MFWCPVSVVQPTEKRTAPTAPPLDRGQGHPQAAPAGQFRQVDCLRRPAVCGWRREGSLGQMPAERPTSSGVTPCCAGLECAAPACPVPIVSDRVAGAVQGLVVAQAIVPDAANDLGGNIPYLPLQGKAHVGSAGEVEFQQLGLVGDDLHAEDHVDPQLLDHVDQLVQGVSQGEFSDDGFPSFHHRLLGPERRR